MKIILPTLGLLAGTSMASITMGSESDDAPSFSEDGPDGKRIGMSYRTFLAASLAELYPELDGITNLQRMVNRVLRNYGCNCYQTQFASHGLHTLHLGGVAIDDVDKTCAKYARVFRCIQEDSGNSLVADYNDFPENHWKINRPDGGDSNNPQDTAPPSEFLDGKKNHEIVRQCGQWSHFEHHVDPNGSVLCGPADDAGYASKDANFCPKMVCEVSQAFVQDLVNAAGNTNQFSDPLAFWRANQGGAVFNADCTPLGGTVEACCGSYPDSRTPVVTTTQQCCNAGSSNEYKTAIGDACQ